MRRSSVQELRPLGGGVPEDDAMEHCTRKPEDETAIPTFSRDSIEQGMRRRIRDTIEALVKEELDAALGAVKSARVGEQRQGYVTARESGH